MVIRTMFEDRHLIYGMLAAIVGGAALLFMPLLVFVAIAAVIICIISCIKIPKTTMTILALYIIFQNFLVFQLGETSQIGIILKRSEELIILLAFLIMILRNISKGKIWKRSIIDTPLAILILIGILSSVKYRLTSYRVASLDLYMLLKGFLVFYIFYNMDFKETEIRKIVKIFFSVSLIIFLFGIVDLIIPAQFRTFIHNRITIDYRFGIPSVQSIFIHPAVFGWFMAFIACFCFSFFIIFEKKVYLVGAVLFVVGSLLSIKFKPIVGMALALIPVFFLVKRTKKFKFIFVIGCFALILILLFGAKARLLLNDRIYTYIEAPRLNQEARNVLYFTSMRIAKDFFPFGAGFGTFGGWIAALYYSPLYTKYRISSIYGLERGGHFLTDTFWPYILGEFGVMGLVCYIWIVIALFISSIKAFKSNDNLFIKAFSLGSVMILAEGVAESVGGHTFMTSPPFFFVFASLGVANSFLIKTGKSNNIQL